MKSKHIHITEKDITDVLVLANCSLNTINFIVDYWNKTPEEREEVHEELKRIAKGLLDSVFLYLTSPINEQKAILVELRKLGEKLAIAKLHKILGINEPDISNEMKFENPYQYDEDR